MAWYGIYLFSLWSTTKNVAKELREICAGLVRARDRMWFTELSDKDMFFLEIFTINGVSHYSARSTKNALVLVHEKLWWQL